MSFFEKLKQGMTKTRKNIAEKLSGVFSMFTRVDEDLLEELEETLILCDVGVNTATRVIGTLRERIKAERSARWMRSRRPSRRFCWNRCSFCRQRRPSRG